MADKDLYAVLGVAKTASTDDLRRAYRKLARQYHPDVNADDKAAEERFKAVSAAYDILSDPKKRRLYDEFGEAGVREGFDADKARAYQRYASSGGGNPFAGGGSPFGGGTGGPFGGGAGGAEFDLGDMLGDLFGGRGGRGPRRGRDLVATVEIDFLHALQGTEVQMQLPSQSACAACQGTGRQRGMAACRQCGGSGRHGSAETLTVRIPPGADEGSRLRVPGRGQPAGPGGQAGDLLIETHIRPHPHFSRTGLDLTVRLPVTLHEAYAGSTVSVPTPHGAVKLRVPARSQPGDRLRLRGKGVTRGKRTGDLFVELDVRLPDQADPALEAALQAAEGCYSAPVRAAVTL